MTQSDIDIIQMIGSAGLMVQLVLFLLLFFSVASWTIIFIKWRTLNRALRESAVFTDYFWKSRDLAGVYAKAKQLAGCPVARIFRVGYVELKKLSQSGGGPSAGEAHKSRDTEGQRVSRAADGVDRAMRRAISSETIRLSQMVPFLATTGNTTPFIGLFGTVWGIMNSFHMIGLRGSASLAAVAPGISEALVATAAGLAAAIPAVIAFNHFMNKIRIIESELVSFSSDFVGIIERDLLTEAP
ncbi:protein TolQ [Desulfatitalea alkaliphila]|uniref:Protein TolQ n=1 Tax=Desulfatitalea alkaliphila TaxID=2929485 RepID=A0AA41R327_9BACT|nr:protein TolQ [Desulfatitalea alkaliphila]MCJ8500538.1 protein TolQ [Desulfatitalea alkaliphila]